VLAENVPVDGVLRLSCVDWKSYVRFLRMFEERPTFRLTYDDGELEIRSPTLKHDDDSRFMGRLVHVLTEELEMPIKGGGSVTMKRRLKLKGIEADECFWIANAKRMKGRRDLDFRRDPPPDLAIEVDVTHSSMDRMGIYAALRVPEVWQLEGNLLTFHVLGSRGKYAAAETSLSFPLVKPADIMRFVRFARNADDQNLVTRDFRDWIRKRLAKQS